MLHFLATGDVGMSSLAVETSDVPYALRVPYALVSWLSQDETDQFTPLQLSYQPFCLVVNLWFFKLSLKESVTTNYIKQKQGG